jgi:hypothetical protein
MRLSRRRRPTHEELQAASARIDALETELAALSERPVAKLSFVEELDEAALPRDFKKAA